MGTDFSDPAWWPTPPPKPPRRISTSAIVFGTILPVAVIAIVVVGIVGERKHASAASGRSIAAFEACMRAEGATSPSERTNSRFLQQDAEACQMHLPRNVRLPSFQAPTGADEATQRAFSQCMQAATANLSRGRFGGSSARTAFRNAIDTCRSLIGAGRGGGAAAATTTTAVA